MKRAGYAGDPAEGCDKATDVALPRKEGVPPRICDEDGDVHACAFAGMSKPGRR